VVHRRCQAKVRKVNSTRDALTAFAEVLAAQPSEAERKALVKRAKLEALGKASGEALDGPAPMNFDVDGDLVSPDWIVVGQIERNQVVVLSADTGAAKSILSQHLAVQTVAGLDWLGCETRAERVLYLDEENPERTVKRRLKALGIEQAELGARLRYFNRKGLSIGDGGMTDAWLPSECESFRPDLIIIDTLMAATAIDETNDNGKAVKMMKHLRQLAEQFDCAVLVLHHERKQSKDHPNSSGQAAMGARQWIGQADAQMTLTVASPMDVREWDSPLGDEQLARMSADVLVEHEGEYLSEHAETELDAVAVQIGAFLQSLGRETKRADIAKGVARDAKDKTFRRALDAAVERSYIAKVKQGIYAPGSEKVLDVG
jgi:RecA-family ATPase